MSHRTRLLFAAAALALALPAAAASQRRQQVVLPGPVPYLTPIPPLVGKTALPQLYIAPRLHISSAQHVFVGLGPDARPALVRVRQRLVVHGKGDYQLAVGGPIDDVRPAPGTQSTPGLRTDQLLWAGFSPSRKVLAADAVLRAPDAAKYLPLRLRLERQGDRVVLTVINATAAPQPVYTGTVRLPEVAGLLDETRRASLAGARLKGTFATFVGDVKTLAKPLQISAPLQVQGDLTLPGQAPVRFDRTLGDGRPLSFTVEASGTGTPKVHLEARPAPVVRLLQPPAGAATWAAAVRRNPPPAAQLVLRLMTTRLQLVRADQFQSYLADPDADGRSRTVYEYRDRGAQIASGRCGLDRRRRRRRRRDRRAAGRAGGARRDRPGGRRPGRLGSLLAGSPAPAANRARMADVPDSLVLKRDRDLEGRRNDIWVKRGLMTLVAVVPFLALFNVFGQRPDTTTLASPAASLKIYAPSKLRGGLLYEARFHVTAIDNIKDAYLVLGTGWAEGMSINTIEPSPVSETSDNGRLSFELGPIQAGQSYIQFMQFQVNPTNIAFGRPQTVWLNDGKNRLITYQRKLTVYP